MSRWSRVLSAEMVRASWCSSRFIGGLAWRAVSLACCAPAIEVTARTSRAASAAECVRNMRNLLEVHATDRTEARASVKRRDADTGPAVAGRKSAFSGGEGQYVRERTACADTILALRQRSYAG